LKSTSVNAAIVPSPAKSTASSIQHMDALDFELAGMDAEGPSGLEPDASMGAPPSPSEPASPPVRSPNKRNRKSNATSVGDFRDMEDEHRLSLGRIKSRERIVDPDDEDEDDGPGAGDFSFGAEDASLPMDFGNDDQFDAGGNDFGAVAGDMADEDISLEAAAVARENQEGQDEEEEEEVEPLRRPVKTKTKGAARSRATSSQARGAKQAEKLAERKRMRLSRIGAEDENQYVGDFVMRRSGRTHMAPLEYWRGEKVAYGRGHGLTEIKEVIRLQPDVRPSLSKSRAARARSASEKPKRKVEDKENFEGWDDNTDPVGHVTEFATGKDIQRSA
jgi:centromere protein C